MRLKRALILIPILVGLFILFSVLKYSVNTTSVFKSSTSVLTDFELRLENRCLVSDNYFSVEVKGSNKKFRFSNGKLRVKLAKNSQIRLSISSDHKDFHYSDRYRPINNKLVLIADCGIDRSIEDAFKSLNETFR